MNRNEVIKLAEKADLLVENENFPYNSPAQQRLISRLEKFAAATHACGYEDGTASSVQQQEPTDN